jgi:hypothetical protein
MDTLTDADTSILLDVDFDPIKPCWNPDHTATVDAVWIASNCHMAINVCDGCRANALRRAGAVLCSNCLQPADKCWRFLPIGGTP